MQLLIAIAGIACVLSGCGTGRSKAAEPTCASVVTSDGTVSFYRNYNGLIIAYARCGGVAKEMPASAQYTDCPNDDQRAQLASLVKSVCSSSGPTITPPTDAPATAARPTAAPETTRGAQTTPDTTAAPVPVTAEAPTAAPTEAPTEAPTTTEAPVVPTTTEAEPVTVPAGRMGGATRFRTF